jgi:NAD+ synthase (glutamine-hydrolysing)
MKVGLAQIDSWVGDLEGNVERCVSAVERATAAGAELIVLPEMAVPGPFPRDLLFDATFADAAFEATRDLAVRLRAAPPVVVGTIARPAGWPHGLVNAAALLEGGAIRTVYAKRKLRADDVYHETRWFTPGSASGETAVGGRHVELAVSHDLETAQPCASETLACSAALPYAPGETRRRVEGATRLQRQVVFVNACGSQDELILEGRSFALNRRGELLALLPAFEEAVQVVDLHGETRDSAPSVPWETDVLQALCAGLAGFARKNQVGRVFLGLSGGVDSSLVAVLAARALGPDRVTGVAIPSRHTDPRSTECARQLARDLGIGFEVVPLETLHLAAERALGDLVAEGVGAENVQARLRMVVLMAHVNRHGGLLLNTSNKTELATGYGTLYGDLAGALSPIGDLTKPQVYALARHLNAERPLIPTFALDRPPSAELRPDQVDPFDYETIAPELERLVQENRSNAVLARSEHKRRQGALVLRVSAKAFGSGRMFPITRR